MTEGERPRGDHTAEQRFVAGEERAFAEVVRAHQAVVFRVARRYANSPDEAADLAQRTFLRALQAFRRPFGRPALEADAVRAWLLRITLNLVKNQVRDARRWTAADGAALERLADPHSGALARLEEAERRRRTRAAVLELPRRQREIVSLRIDAELPFAEIGRALGITENNAKVQFHLALRRLRERAAEETR